jgi:hypothetical protein
VATVADVAGNQLGDELGDAFAQRNTQHRRMRVARLEVGQAGLLDVHVLVRDHVHEAVLHIGIHEIGCAQRFQADDHPALRGQPDRPATADRDGHRRKRGLRIDRLQVAEHLHQALLHRRQLGQAVSSLRIQLGLAGNGSAMRSGVTRRALASSPRPGTAFGQVPPAGQRWACRRCCRRARRSGWHR